MTVQMNTKISGEYKFVIMNTETNEEKETEWIPNLITDFGIDKLYLGSSYSGDTTNNWAYYCSVGADNTPPTESDEALFNKIGATASYDTGYNSSSVEGAPNYRSIHTTKYTFTQGSVEGNISEVGVGSKSDGTKLVSRALILDGNGNPTTLSLTSIDQLTVYYRITIQFPLSLTGSLDFNGTTVYYKAQTYRIISQSSAGFAASGITQLLAETYQYSNYSMIFYDTTVDFPANPTLNVTYGGTSNYIQCQSSSHGSTANNRTSLIPGATYVDSTYLITDAGGAPSSGNGLGFLVFRGLAAYQPYYIGIKLYSDAGLTTPYGVPKTSSNTFSFVCRLTVSRV